MVDNFSLLVSHALMLIAAVRLLFMPELDHEPTVRDEEGRRSASGKAPRDA